MGIKKIFHKPVNSAVNLLSSIMPHGEELSEKAQAVIALMGAVLWADGKLEKSEIDSFREILSSKYSAKQVDKFVNILQRSKNIDLAENCNRLAAMDITDDERQRFITALLELSFSNNDFCPAQREMIETIADKLSVNRETLDVYIQEVEQQQSKKNKIVQSGTGIIVALIIVLIFILAATFLKAVVFGLILAYLFLPLEKFYERKFTTSPVFLKLFYLAGALLAPFQKLSEHFNRNKETIESTEEELEERRITALVNRATTATVGTFVALSIMIIIVIALFSFNYASGMSGSLKKWFEHNIKPSAKVIDSAKPGKDVIISKNKTVGIADKAVVTAKKTSQSVPDVMAEDKNVDSKLKKAMPVSETATKSSSEDKTFLSDLAKKLEELKPKVTKIPIVEWGIEQVSQYLNNQENQKALISLIMKKTSGVFTFTAGFVANIFAFLLEILLTIFFFSLILNKMATFNSGNADSDQQSGYLVESVFNSKWMPQTSEGTLAEAKRIINAIIEKLRRWLKGYMSIIAIETTVYVIGFAIIGVPYAIILGMIAGCTVLLPYIGPLASGVFTCLVCLAVGGDNVMVTVVIVALFYMIMNGVVEQLFLYPTLVGEALGLTTLETIIVVLLGGVFAGFFGMIFAVPAASVMKYMIPQIYKCWQRE
ncbi:MAG: AI-2E family transporter [Victivallaceae bacterium]|nr:AI-2E family transporter [Victivallaceae bacterium]